jgi:DNA-binding phage protein
MTKSDELTEKRIAATANALRGVIAESDYRTARAIATELGMNYTTLTRNLNNEQPIKMSTLFSVLELVNLSPADFFARVDAAITQS